MNTKVKEFLDKTDGVNFESVNDMLDYAKENANVYVSHAPHLNKDLQPMFELVDKSECKNSEMCGDCHKCEYMVDALSENGEIFMYTTLKLVCVY